MLKAHTKTLLIFKVVFHHPYKVVLAVLNFMCEKGQSQWNCLWLKLLNKRLQFFITRQAQFFAQSTARYIDSIQACVAEFRNFFV